jgi:hypothetical protein
MARALEEALAIQNIQIVDSQIKEKGAFSI